MESDGSRPASAARRACANDSTSSISTQIRFAGNNVTVMICITKCYRLNMLQKFHIFLQVTIRQRCPRCFSPNSNLVQRTIELNYAKKKRATSIKWFFVNMTVFLVFTFDLTWSGPCSGSLARYAQLAAAGAACAGALRHALRLLPRPAPSAPPARLSRRQLRLLGLSLGPAGLNMLWILS
ncbi:hypothetical protein RR48_02872 [Papilio machaon]|uniref:Uncharacterized protein n=1 Tax=Papilio machaon TaxID=76193 RepID=A0A0N1INC1_PAPMA|nr:hypothetical protein RR48_02872 [Papilio machaon]